MSPVEPDRAHADGFGAGAGLYAAYRPGYPDWIFDRLVAALPGPPARAVDLGAGTGQATRALARRFAHVTAVEPDRRMADLIAGGDNVSVVNARAEDASFASGAIDAVVSATAFHWMDQVRVCRLAADWLRPGGVFMPFLYGPFRVEGAAAEIYRRHSLFWRPYKDARLAQNVNYAAAVSAVGLFSDVEAFGEDVRFDCSSAELVGLVLTMSYARAYAEANGGVDAYRGRLASEIDAAGGDVTVVSHLGGVVARRRSD